MRRLNEENCDGLTRSLTNYFPSVQKQQMNIADLTSEQCIAILDIVGSDGMEETEVICQLLSLKIVLLRDDGNYYLTELGVKLYEQLVEDSR